MSRFARWLIIFSKWALFLTAVVCGWLWARTYWSGDVVMRQRVWLPAVVCGVWPVVSVCFGWRERELRKERSQAGHCGNCGYDLRATPHRGGQLIAKCPECGAEFLWTFLKAR